MSASIAVQVQIEPKPTVFRSAAGTFFLLHAAERPNFVALDALGAEVADVRIVEALAGRADFADETQHGHLRCARHPAG